MWLQSSCVSVSEYSWWGNCVCEAIMRQSCQTIFISFCESVTQCWGMITAGFHYWDNGTNWRVTQQIQIWEWPCLAWDESMFSQGSNQTWSIYMLMNYWICQIQVILHYLFIGSRSVMTKGRRFVRPGQHLVLVPDYGWQEIWETEYRKLELSFCSLQTGFIKCFKFCHVSLLLYI